MTSTQVDINRELSNGAMEDEGSVQWSNSEVLCLLSLWGEEAVQAKCRVVTETNLYLKTFRGKWESAALSARGYNANVK